jgi:hypothetical protein
VGASRLNNNWWIWALLGWKKAPGTEIVPIPIAPLKTITWQRIQRMVVSQSWKERERERERERESIRNWKKSSKFAHTHASVLAWFFLLAIKTLPEKEFSSMHNCSAVSISSLSYHGGSQFHQIASSASVCNAQMSQLGGSMWHFWELQMSKTLHQGSHPELHFLTRHSHCHGFVVTNWWRVVEGLGKRVTELCLMVYTLFDIPVSCSSAHGLQTVIVAHSVPTYTTQTIRH